eukprot:3330882-Rhodomonas_salina.2
MEEVGAPDPGEGRMPGNDTVGGGRKPVRGWDERGERWKRSVHGGKGVPDSRRGAHVPPDCQTQILRCRDPKSQSHTLRH